MPTITIDIPDTVCIPADWDAQSFVLSKMYESGMIASRLEVQNEEEADDIVDDEPDWMTPELREKIKENRRRLEEEWAKNPPKMSHEEFLQLILNCPVADEETIALQDEAREHMKQWKTRW
jgi:hypothetical protein